MEKYKCLNKNIYNSGKYKILPLRFQDRYDIMKWRNEQKYHLRQENNLTKEEQDLYFEKVINNLFRIKFPNQILFSYLENDKCVGYGGLVHINWQKREGEISFIMNTSLEKIFFDFHWKKFLFLIEKVAFKDLSFKKIFTYAYDLRPHIYKIFEDVGYSKESELKNQILHNGEYKSVIIHSKRNK
tara:strand:+ start:25020 stop:25574 length:555 start_codon:yes stop_codon:yes gene_type:complete